MILVNNPGNDSAYWPLKHAEWNGWTPTDLIFPFFIFIVGVSLVFSFESRLKRGISRKELLMHTVRRSLIIFLIGVLLNGFPLYHLATLRIYGVLQRIALAYLASAVLVLYSSTRVRLLISAALLLLYWILMRLVPVPGFGVPGRDIPLLHPDANLTAYLDRKLLMGHLYEGTRDPEGLLSTLPAIAGALLGVLTGEWLRSQAAAVRKGAWMFVFGVIGVAMGEFWGVWFPINKKLWTSSFVLFTTGLALICLALSYWLTDIKRWRRAWTKPFLIFGMNAIAAYTFAELLEKIGWAVEVHTGAGTLTAHDYVFQRVFAPLGNPSLASLIYSIVFVAASFLPIWLMYQKRIFLKV